MRLKDKVVLITGGSRGVGAACAVACAKEGAKVVVASKSMEPHPKLPGTLRETVKRVEEAGSQGHAIQCDVRFEEQVDAMVKETVETFGRLDALVNNAGAIFWANTAEHPTKRFDLVMGVNVRAAFLASRAAIPHLREAGGGHILMMSPPIDHPESCVGKAPYILSKFGMTLLGMAIDEEESAVAAHALWPVTMIQTAATINFAMAQAEQMRSPGILADATVALLARDPAECSFRAWLDEEVLAEQGVSDLSKYRCVPDSEPPPLSIQLVNPSWTRG